MPRPVSIIVWRDARDDPPKGGGGVLAYFAYLGRPVSCSAEELRVTASAGDLWAEIPVLSDLTDEDMDYTIVNVEQVAQLIEEQGPDFGGVPADEVVADIRARRDRLRAALGGEKEEA